MAKTNVNKQKSGIKPPFRKIFDAQNNVIGGISKNSICDPDGNSIATLSGVETVTVETGKKPKQKKERVYQSEKGEFRARSGEITLNGAPFGAVNNAWVIPVVLGASAAAVVALSLVTVLVIRPWVPSSKTPVIDIGDGNGPWTETVNILPETIYPGGNGEHSFVLTNPHDDPMVYRFDITEIYNGQKVHDFPIEFRMVKNGQPITDYWYTADELEQFRFTVLKGDKLECGLQWRWEFERGKDDEDTKYGVENGKYSLDILITNTAAVYD